MSPEQAAGRGDRVDGRSDIFSVGVVFYELLTGRSPFRGDGLSLPGEMALADIRPPRQLDPKVPRRLEQICLKCLQREPEQRYATAADLASDLERWLRPSKKSRILAGVGGLLAVALLLTVLAISLNWESTPPDQQEGSPATASQSADGQVSLRTLDLYLSDLDADPPVQHIGLVLAGGQQLVEPISALQVGDGIRVEAQFAEATPWYYLLVEPSGQLTVVESDSDASEFAFFPAGQSTDQREMAVFDEDTKPGVHLLLLVSASEIDPQLEERVRDALGTVDMMEELPQQWSVMRSFGTAAEPRYMPQTSLSVLRKFAEFLPEGHRPLHALYLQVAEQ